MTVLVCPSDVRKILPWVKNGVTAGIQKKYSQLRREKPTGGWLKAGLEASRVLGENFPIVALLKNRVNLVGELLFKTTRTIGMDKSQRDWRITQINKCQNIEVFPESFMTLRACWS